MAAHFLECCSGEIQKTDKNHRFDNRRRGHENSPPQSLWALRFFHCAPRKTALVQTVPSKMATACFHFAKPGVGPWLRGALRQVRYARHRNCRVPENNSERLILDLEGKLPKLRRSLRSLEFGRNAAVPRSKSPGKLQEFQTILASVTDLAHHQGGYRGVLALASGKSESPDVTVVALWDSLQAIRASEKNLFLTQAISRFLACCDGLPHITEQELLASDLIAVSVRAKV